MIVRLSDLRKIILILNIMGLCVIVCSWWLLKPSLSLSVTSREKIPYCLESAPSTVRLTGNRVRDDESTTIILHDLFIATLMKTLRSNTFLYHVNKQ